MKILAIIPARGGSKGVPGKNIKLLGEKPLIAHSIICAQESKKLSKFVVTTDSEEIAAISKKHNATVIQRPADLAADDSNVVTAVTHVLQQLDETYDLIILLQPTSPLRTATDLDSIISMFEEDKNLDGVISVVQFDDCHPARMYTLDKNLSLSPFIDGDETLRRQDLTPVYYRNGCFYAVKTEAFLKEKSFMVKHKKAYIMDVNWMANIDSQRDFKIAELLYDEWNTENNSN
jgi:CMP-N-acetylneuraminic acid synthetase